MEGFEYISPLLLSFCVLLSAAFLGGSVFFSAEAAPKPFAAIMDRLRPSNGREVVENPCTGALDDNDNASATNKKRRRVGDGDDIRDIC